MPQSLLPNTFNLIPQNLRKWRAAKARVASGSGNARILFMGDSTTFGEFSNSGADTGDLTNNSITARISDYLSAAGLPTSENSFAGMSISGYPNRAVNDGRVVVSGGWAASAGGGVGGSFMVCTSTGAITFTPRTNCDSFKIYYATLSTGGTFSYGVNGGSTTNQSEVGADGIGSVTITGNAGLANVLNINWVSGSCYIAGIEAWNSTISQVILQNAGWGTSNAANWNNNSAAYTSPQAIPSFSGDLSYLCLGINDWCLGVSQSSFITNMQALITKALTTGDVILVSPAPSSTGSATLANQESLVQAMYDLAASNNIPLIDNFARFQSYTVSNGLGLMGQALHPNQLGYADLAQTIANALIMI